MAANYGNQKTVRGNQHNFRRRTYIQEDSEDEYTNSYRETSYERRAHPSRSFDVSADRCHEILLNAPISKKKRNKLLGILSNLKACDVEKRNFIRSFENWKENREESIEILTAIAREIEEDGKKVDVAKTFEAFFDITGELAGVFGQALSKSHPVASERMSQYNKVATGLATGINMGCSVAERFQNISTVAKSKAVLQKDQREFERLSILFERTKRLFNAIEDLMDVDVFETVMELTNNFHERGLSAGRYSNLGSYLNSNLQELNIMNPRSPHNVLYDLTSRRDMQVVFSAFSQLYTGNKTLSLFLKDRNMTNVTRFVPRSVLMELTEASESTMSPVDGVLSVIGIALDVIAGLPSGNRSIDRKPSDYIPLIEDIVSGMKREVFELEKLYDLYAYSN